MERVMLLRNAEEVFKELRSFCTYKEYKIKKINSETKTINAKKGRQVFGDLIEVELQVNEVDEKIANVKIEILKRGITQKEAEEELVKDIYNFF